MVFHHKMSAKDHVQGITNLKLFLTLFTLYYQAARTGGEQKGLFGHYPLTSLQIIGHTSSARKVFKHSRVR
jgi:hypothetical protein